MQKFTGVLTDFFETGCEGVLWMLYKDGIEGYEAFELIEEDDHLKIFAEDGSVLFDDVIRLDHKAGWTRYPGNRRYGQPTALGRWIHWTQKGFQPDDWARFFIRDGKPPLRAELTRDDRPKKAKKKGKKRTR
jgi:hypothetical protein